jgi:RNA polymerase sigma factor (sigma-70 family)
MLAGNDREFHELMQRAFSGSHEAAQELFRAYEPYLLMAIRRRLNPRIRSQFDSLDFAQDVWASFFADSPAKRQFTNADELIAFLTKVARNKVIDVVRQSRTQKNNLLREQSLDDSQRFDKNRLAAVQPTPSQVLMTKEEWTEFLRKQPLVYRRVFILLREGKTQEAIANELGLNPRTIHRIVQRAVPGEIR